MATQSHTQTLSFQAEVAQLLKLVTHSLYSNPDIFLRELISNASDACDRLRFEGLNDAALYEGDADLQVRVSFDGAAKTLTITDNGIGLSQQEAIEHLGTIAKSGTRDFMARLSGEQKNDAQLIGQFGVGFYSGFIVADKITVESRRAGITDLRHGNVLAADWQSADRFERMPDARQPLPLPAGVSCYAVAASTLASGAGALAPVRETLIRSLVGDGLVPLESALGRHEDPTRTLAFATENQWIAQGMNHLELLNRPEVGRQLMQRLSEDPLRAPRGSC